MKDSRNVILGLFIILFGVLLLLKFTGLVDLDIFFEGWWTLFIIIPSLIGLFNDPDKTGSLFGIAIGLLLLLAARDVIDYSFIWKIIVPIVIILFGLSLVFRNFFARKVKDKMDEINTDGKSYTAVFAGQEYKLAKEEFKGCDMNAIFGGIDLDLRDAKFTQDTKIKICCIFGGVDLFVPDNVNVEIISSSFFGGVEDKRNKEKEGKYTLYIEATCIFGGVDIK